MFLIRTYAALSDVSAAFEGNELHALLEAHFERLAAYADFDLTDLAMIAIVMPGDTLSSIENEFGLPLIDDAGTFKMTPEIIQRHSCWFELAFVMSDDGFGLIFFVPIEGNTDAALLAATEAAFADAGEGA